jgi:hypothetical protein
MFFIRNSRYKLISLLVVYKKVKDSPTTTFKELITVSSELIIKRVYEMSHKNYRAIYTNRDLPAGRHGDNFYGEFPSERLSRAGI